MTEEYSVYEIARCIIAERLKVEESQIIDSTDLGYDLGADSLDLIDILLRIKSKRRMLRRFLTLHLLLSLLFKNYHLYSRSFKIKRRQIDVFFT